MRWTSMPNIIIQTISPENARAHTEPIALPGPLGWWVKLEAWDRLSKTVRLCSGGAPPRDFLIRRPVARTPGCAGGMVPAAGCSNRVAWRLMVEVIDSRRSRRRRRVRDIIGATSLIVWQMFARTSVQCTRSHRVTCSMCRRRRPMQLFARACTRRTGHWCKWCKWSYIQHSQRKAASLLPPTE